MLMQEIRRQNYQVFKGVEDARKRSALENTLKYVDSLAGSAGINVSEWPVLEIFHNQNTGQLHTDKVKINQAFFVWAKQAKPSTSRITAQRKMALVDIHNGFKVTRKEALLRQLRTQQEYARQHLANYEKYMIAASKINQQIMATNETSPDAIAMDLSEVIADGWYKIFNITRTTITLETDDIVLSYKNDAQKVDIRVPMGKFLVSFHFDRAALVVEMSQNNILLSGNFSGYFHPHVVPSGGICFGNIRDAATLAISNFDIKTAFNAARAVLMNYNDDNPYVQLYVFDRKFKLDLEVKNGTKKEEQIEEEDDE